MDTFRKRPDESTRVQLRVTVDDPYPRTTIKLTAPRNKSDNSRSILATFSILGQIIGSAARAVRVLSRRESLTPSGQSGARGNDMRVPPPENAPDLTITIAPTHFKPESLAWSVTSPWLRPQELPTEPMTTDIGTTPERFMVTLIEGVLRHERQGDVSNFLRGRGKVIAQKVPKIVWDALRKVAARVAEASQALGVSPWPRRPTVLILSSEPYVPWELAVLDPPLDPALPEFLGAQSIVGRWILWQNADRPDKFPPVEAAGDRMAVVSGKYDAPGWARLEHAEEEARLIVAKYAAIPVDATVKDVLGCLEREPPKDVLHFSLHGSYDPNGRIDGLVLVDRGILDPDVVRGTKLSGAPFVFLNACQVGAGQKVLGDYAGMAEAFLSAGASAVIAPLWSIDDERSVEIALKFYEDVFGGMRPAEYVRDARARFVGKAKSATCVAYQFFGHPLMAIKRE